MTPASDNKMIKTKLAADVKIMETSMGRLKEKRWTHTAIKERTSSANPTFYGKETMTRVAVNEEKIKRVCLFMA